MRTGAHPCAERAERAGPQDHDPRPVTRGLENGHVIEIAGNGVFSDGGGKTGVQVHRKGAR